MEDNRNTDYSFIQCEYPFDQLVEAAYRAPSGGERALFIRCLIELFDLRIGRSTSHQLDYDRNHEMSDTMLSINYCLHDPLCRETVWKWMNALIEEACGDSKQEAALLVGLFDICEEQPLKWDDSVEVFYIDKFFQCLEAPKSQWVVLGAYEHIAGERFREDICQYDQWCRQQERSGPSLSDEEIERLVQYYNCVYQDVTTANPNRDIDP